MAKDKLPVYLLYGEDDFEIARYIAGLSGKLGDPATAGLNTARYEGRSLSLETLLGAARTPPFLAARRLVIVSNPLAMPRLNHPAGREAFQKLLEGTPPDIALVLVEYRDLSIVEDKRSNRRNWLFTWAKEHPEIVYVKPFPLPGRAGMIEWIQKRAKELGGSITPQGAAKLAEQVGNNLRLADQEIQKLLAYVAGKRPVEADDVSYLTPSLSLIEDFALVNALRARDSHRALAELHKLLEKDEFVEIFGMIVSQVRLVLLAREVLDKGGDIHRVAAELLKGGFIRNKYPGELAAQQAGNFSMGELESIYRQLLEIDTAVKSSQMDGDIALDLLVTELTAQQSHSRSYR